MKMRPALRHSMKYLGIMLFVLVIVQGLFVTTSYAAYPLITDDTGTQGRGKSLFELCGQASYDKMDSHDDSGVHISAKSWEYEARATLTYGRLWNILDVVLGMPYQWKKTEENYVTTSDVDGVADMSLEIKLRIYEKDGVSFAIKPGLTLPTGDKDKDLGTGKATGSLYVIVTKELNSLAFHLNLGYKRNENKLEQREDIWHASFAGEYKVIQNLKLIANIGAERNTDPSSSSHPAFLLGGAIYSFRDNLDFCFGIKIGLNETEKDVAFMGGVALKF